MNIILIKILYLITIMFSVSQSITLDELDQYKKYISEIINRLCNENSLSIKKSITLEGNVKFALEFRAPEWFRELSEDIQEVAFNNLQRIMKNRVLKITSEEESLQHISECDCCNHQSKRMKY